MILAIDCGSTNLKVAAFDDQLIRRAQCAKAVTYSIRSTDRVEFDPEGIWRDTMVLIKQVCAAAAIRPRQIERIAIASQAQTFTLADASGAPLMPFLGWADKRARVESAELVRRLGRQFHEHCSFGTPLPELQVSKLFWAVRHVRPLPAGFTVLPLPSFLAFRLAGLNQTDVNLAAMSGLYSLRMGDWWPQALSACGVSRRECVPVVPTGAAVPARAACRGLEWHPSLNIVFAGNDQSAGAYANLQHAGELLITLGTALVAYRRAGPSPVPVHAHSCWGPYPAGGCYELATRDGGCAALDWAVSQLRPNDAPGFFRLAATAPLGRALFDPEQAGTFSAWSGPPEVAGRARAVLEGIAFSLRELVESLDPDAAIVPATPLSSPAMATVIGGGKASAFWLQMLANVLRRPLRRGQGDALLGAAMLARPEVIPPLACDDRAVFLPDGSQADDYESLFAVWRRKFRAVSSP